MIDDVLTMNELNFGRMDAKARENQCQEFDMNSVQYPKVAVISLKQRETKPELNQVVPTPRLH